MKRQMLVPVVVMMFGSTSVSHAQAPQWGRPADVVIMTEPQGQITRAPFPGMFEVVMAEPLEIGEPIVGAPYSATIVTTVVQLLSDGNRIENESTSTVARDGTGRVRREQQLAALGPFVPAPSLQIVTISDPANGVFYSLDTERKVATRSRHVRVGVLDREHAPVVLGPAIQVPAPRSVSLGTQVIDGLIVEGTRVTSSVPAGAIGNQQAIEIVSERWFSPELRVTILSTLSDPRFGETTYRLTNIQRAEPPAERFRVPGDYKIQDAPPPPLIQ